MYRKYDDSRRLVEWCQEKRRRRLQQAYTEFQDSRLQSFCSSWEQAASLNEAQKKLVVNATSLHELANSLATLQSNKRGMVLTPASSVGATRTSATGAADTDEVSRVTGSSPVENDELAPDLTTAVPPSGNKSDPFYELISYVFQEICTTHVFLH
ncbi:MAG: hypothetical protein JOS17DRAFT_771927 [Linnemannia elongata]|nr:MAG: hypothetical protein JOS17DRAFT_771927 [Linnemannia elongata]